MDPEQPIGALEISELLGMKPISVRNLKYKGALPEPDWPGTCNGSPAWKTSTILLWIKRTGRTLHPDQTAVINKAQRRSGPKTLIEVLTEEGLLEDIHEASGKSG